MLAIVAVLGTGSALAWDGKTFDGSNWLVNGDAESTGTGTKTGAEIGWGTYYGSGKVDVVDYSTLKTLPEEDKPLNAGNNFFIGGSTNTNNGPVILWQAFSFVGNDIATQRIAKGDVEFTLSAYLGKVIENNYYTQTEGSYLVGKFWSGGTVLMDHVVHNVGNDFDVHSDFNYYEWSGIIPANCTKIEIFLNLNKYGGGWDMTGQGNVYNSNYAAADNIQFNVGSAVPEPATMIALGLGLAGIAARKRRK